MSDEMENENPIQIGKIEKNARDTIVVQIKPFKSKYYVDIRNHYEDMEGNLKPTQKGISLEVSRFDELKALIDQVTPKIKELPQS